MKKAVITVLLLSLLASSARAAYVVLLKSGARIVAREKYTVKGSVAHIVLRSGTLTSVPLVSIDVAATDKLNARNLGDAVPLDWLDRDDRPLATPVPTPAVTDLGRIARDAGRPEGEAALPTPTPGISFRAASYPDQQVDQAFHQGLESYHLYLYRSSVGTRPVYYFIEIQVAGKDEVTRALQAVTMTYHLLQQKAPDRSPERVEVQLLNESGREAGLFRISPDQAAELATGAVKAEDFFVKYVIF